MKILTIFCCIVLMTACSPSSADNTPTKTDDGIDTARKETYMTEREKDMIKELNLVRSDPKGYVKVIEEYIYKLKTDRYSDASMIGAEIKTAKELIRELNKTEPMAILQPHKGLYKASKKHGEEGKKKGSLDHQGSNGDWPWDRGTKYASDLTDSNENLVGGPDNVRRSVVILLVDTGIDSRGHRKNILNKDWRYTACYEVGQVAEMPFYWVQMFGK